MELELVKEDIPKISREGGGRSPEPWETHLDPLRSKPSESYRLWTFNTKSQATNRMNGVRSRLVAVAEHEKWTLAVRQVPDTTDYAVYGAFNGHFTDAEMALNRKNRAERSERIKTSLANSKSTNGTSDEDNPDEDNPTGSTSEKLSPKERVAKARAAQK